MADWDVVESVVEYDNHWYTGGYDLVEQPDGSTKRYYWAELPPAVVVVARDGEEIVFVEQYRPAVGEPFLELVAGIVEDEPYEAAARRELAEETGYRAGRAELLEEYWVATGVLRHERAVVYADDLDPGEPAREGNEFLSVTTRPVGEALAAARESPSNDATIEGLLLARKEGFI